MIKRPSANETEEDLLRFQEEFLSNFKKNQTSSDSELSASVYKSTKARPVDTSAVKINNEKGDPAWHPSPNEPLTAVVGEIIERPFDVSKLRPIGQNNTSGFADCEKISDISKVVRGKRKGMSLFARQILTKQCNENKQDSLNNQDISTADDPNADRPISKLLEEVDNENISKLLEMSAEDVAQEVSEITNILPPNLIHFLKNRKSGKSKANGPREKGGKPTVEKLRENINSVISKDNQEKFFHMDSVESEKLQWTKDIAISQDAEKALQAVETRFDFLGFIAPIEASLEEIPTSSALFHHGEEPDRPGYTLSELLLLARSRNVQQRILALRTLSRICKLARQGYYVELGISKAIIPCLLQSGYAFVIRQSLDDSSSEAGVVASLASLHDLLVEENDEQLVNCWNCLNQPKNPLFCYEVIAQPISDEKIANMTDEELMLYDVVVCLVFRTNLLARLRYILLDWPMLSQEQNIVRKMIISILIRITRHSPVCAQQILSGASGKRMFEEGILKDNFFQNVPNSVKLMAALCQIVPAGFLTLNFDIHRLTDVLTAKNCENVEMQCLIDSIGFFSNSCSIGNGQAKDLALVLAQHFSAECTKILSSFQQPLKIPNDMGLKYICAVFQLYTKLVQKSDESYDFYGPAFGLLDMVFSIFIDKLSHILETSSETSEDFLLFLVCSYQLLAASPDFLERISSFNFSKCRKLTQLTLDKAVEYSLAHSLHSLLLLDPAELNLEKVESTNSLQYFSCLRCISKERFSGNANGAWCLAYSVLKALCSSELLSNGTLLNAEINSYFRKITLKKSNLASTGKFFQLNFEMLFASAYLKLGKIDNLKSVYGAAFKIVPIYPTLLEDSLWHSFINGVLLNKKFLDHLDSSFGKITDNLQLVCSVYHDSLSALMCNQSSVPFSKATLCKDWQYFPLALVGLTISPTVYDIPDDAGMPALRHRIVVAVLRFIRFLLQSVSKCFVQEIDSLSHFVRLVSLYLSDDIFGGAAGEKEGVKGILQHCITLLLDTSPLETIEFSKSVQGLDVPLPDFYIALLEQFKAASYGDVGFGNALLIFTRPDQPISFRRLLWSDHREAITFLKRLRVKDLMIPIAKLLQPFDVNVIMAKLYAEFFFTEIITFGEIAADSVVWIIAITHLNAFLFDGSLNKTVTQMKISMWKTIVTLARNENYKKKMGKLRQLILYKHCSSDNVEIYTELPKNRSNHLRDLLGTQITDELLKNLM